MLEIGEADPQPLRLVAAEVRHERVRDADEVLEDAARLRAPEVERERALVAVEALEEERVGALAVGRDVARDVPSYGRVLDLDHVGAEIGELHRPVRAGAELLDRDDAHVGERPPHSSASSTRARRRDRDRVGAGTERRDVDLVASARPLGVGGEVVAVAVPVGGDERRRKRRGVPDRRPELAEELDRDADERDRAEPDPLHEQRVGIEPVQRLAALGPHPRELRPHGELADLPLRRACVARGIGLVLAPLRLVAPRPRVAEVVSKRQRDDLRHDRDRRVRLGVGLVFERRDPRGGLALPDALPVRAPAGAERGARRLVPEHGAEPPVGLELGHEQLARADVAARSLDEEAAAAVSRLDDALDDPRVLGRHVPVVGAEHDRMAGVVDDRGDGAVVVAVEADDGQRRVGDAVRVEADGRPAVRRGHPPVDGERRAPPRRPDPHRLQASHGLCGGAPDRVEDRLDVRRDELTVAPDPGAPELERDRDGVVVRRARRDPLRRVTLLPRRRPIAPLPPGRRRGCRGRRRRSRRGHRLRPRRRAPSPTARDRSPRRSRGSRFPQPPAGSRPAA